MKTLVNTLAGAASRLGPKLIGAPKYKSSPVTTNTVTTQAETLIGDILVVFVACGGTNSASPPAGWTTLFSNVANTGVTEKLSCYYKVATVDGSTSEVFTTALNNSMSYCFCVRDATTINSATQLSGVSVNAVAPALTNSARCVVLRGFAIPMSNLSKTFTGAVPAGIGMTVSLELCVAYNINVGTNIATATCTSVSTANTVNATVAIS